MATMKTALTTGEVLELAGQKFFYSIDGERLMILCKMIAEASK